jgi:hydroxypyruvate isomerase
VQVRVSARTRRCFGEVIIICLIRGIVKPGVDTVQAMDWLVEALRECSAAARCHGIRLALEPINRTETTLIIQRWYDMEAFGCTI